MFVAFNAYRGSFSERMGNLIDIVFNLKILSLHRERIADIALNEVEDKTKSQEMTIENHQASLEVKDLCFKYDPFSKNVIEHLNLTVKSGESVAITAPSGYGKTTLLKLIAGLLKPTSGTIFFNGIDIYQL